MNTKTKILIADKSTELGSTLKQKLLERGMDVTLCEKDGFKLLDNILSIKPDIVVADVFMPNLDIIGVLDNQYTSISQTIHLVGVILMYMGKNSFTETNIHCDVGQAVSSFNSCVVGHRSGSHSSYLLCFFSLL
jgi:two-component system response regulator (stage 0 sporulation protein A)